MDVINLLSIRHSYWLPISAIIQIALIVHVIRTGRPFWWLWILFCFPFIGPAVYVLAEIAPEMRGPSLHNLWWRLRPPGQRIAMLKEAIEEADTFANRIALAEEYGRQDRYEESIATYEAVLTGLYHDDAYGLLDLAQCYGHLGKYQQCQSILNRVDLSSNRELEGRKALLVARTTEALGQKKQAGELYQNLIPSYPGDEPRYRYALYLLALGQKDQAKTLLAGVLKKYRQSGPLWRREQKEWYRLAKAKLKEIT